MNCSFAGVFDPRHENFNIELRASLSMDKELREYLNSMSGPEKLVILITGYTGNIKHTRLQKLSLIFKALIDGRIPGVHNACPPGGYYDDIGESAENMRDEGFMKYGKVIGYILSDEGKEIFKMISSEDKKAADTVKTASEMFDGISDKKVTEITYKLFPEFAKKTDVENEMDGDGVELDFTWPDRS